MDSKTIKLAEGYEDRSLTEKVSKKVMGCYIEWYTKQGVPDGSNWYKQAKKTTAMFNARTYIPLSIGHS